MVQVVLGAVGGAIGPLPGYYGGLGPMRVLL
ncbi:hypothetical protein FHT82_004702 [Rhizobium sp. BK275]|nr:hypothetical protein [Rhizobium sp. BK275]MBB3410330.1 hypothetical protein [Rhizobium sp. BK316]